MSTTTSTGQPAYYIPQPSHWPITGAIALLLMGSGAAVWVNSYPAGPWMVAAGFAVLVFMMFGWFGTVIGESERRVFSKKVDLSFRWGMSWFIFSEVMFFAAFFGALFYIRNIGGPDLGSLGQKLLWPDYTYSWPTVGPYIKEQFTPMAAIGIPLLNTIILLTSGVTLTIAHHALKAGNRGGLKLWLFLTDRARLPVHRLPGVRVLARVQRDEPEVDDGRLRIDVLHADRVPRRARNDRRDHADGDAVSRVPRPFRRRASFRVRGRPPGTGISSTSSGCCCSCSCTGCSTTR
jgi:hypothetical protein